MDEIDATKLCWKVNIGNILGYRIVDTTLGFKKIICIVSSTPFNACIKISFNHEKNSI